MRLVVIGGSDAGISAGLRARELDPAVQVSLLVADAYPNLSICGLPYYLSGDVPDWRDLAPAPIWRRRGWSCCLPTLPRRSTQWPSTSLSPASTASSSWAMTDSSSGPGRCRSAHRSTASTCPGSTCCTPWPTPSPSTKPSPATPARPSSSAAGTSAWRWPKPSPPAASQSPWSSRPRRSCPPSTNSSASSSARNSAATAFRWSTTSPSRPSTKKPAVSPWSASPTSPPPPTWSWSSSASAPTPTWPSRLAWRPGCGLRDAEATAAGLDPVTVGSVEFDHKAYYPGAHQLHLRITGDRRTGRLLGAQLLGDQRTQVAKRIDIPATALFHHMTVEGLSELDLSYTPPFGSPWDAVQMAAHAWTRELRGGQPTQAASHETHS